MSENIPVRRTVTERLSALSAPFTLTLRVQEHGEITIPIPPRPDTATALRLDVWVGENILGEQQLDESIAVWEVPDAPDA